MVLETNTIKLKNGNIMKLNHGLNCKDYGIYGARCKICQDIYIGQTKNNFSKRWNSHRYNWNLMTNNTKINDKRLEDCTNNKKPTNNWEMKDKQALYIHYTKFHKSNIEHGLNLSDAYEVFFIEKPKYEKLDIQENYYIGKFNAKINISKTFLPKYKWLYQKEEKEDNKINLNTNLRLN